MSLAGNGYFHRDKASGALLIQDLRAERRHGH
jgi:hypothetical protein